VAVMQLPFMPLSIKALIGAPGELTQVWW
jgi:hypothetical protein